MEKEIMIVLINVNATGSCGESARIVCERIESELIDDFDNHSVLSQLSNEDIDGEETYQVWTLTDFMDACNDEVINLNNYFITWVYTIKS